jgi:hydroxypyruvate isomerase
VPIFAASLDCLFTERPARERFEAAALAGFKAVELNDPYDYDALDLRGLLTRNGLALVLQGLPGAGREGARDPGMVLDATREEAFREGVAEAARYARIVGCRSLTCPVAAPPEDQPKALARRVLLRNLAFAADALGETGMRVLVEPVALAPGRAGCLTSSDAARAVIQEVGADNVRLQYDVYHMQRLEGDLVRNIERNIDVLGHVQVADNPGRHEPGTGEINFPFLFDRLDDLGYEGWVGCEYAPSAATQAGLGWVQPYLGPGMALLPGRETPVPGRSA